MLRLGHIRRLPSPPVGWCREVLLGGAWLVLLLVLSQQAGAPAAEAHEFTNAKLIVQHSGKCMRVSGGSTLSGAKIVQWTCGSYTGETVEITAVPGGLGGHQIKFTHSGLCLDVPGNSHQQGLQLQQYQCNQTNAQRWNVPSCSGCTGPITNVESGLCLDVYNQETGNGVAVIQWPCNGQNNQKWNPSLGSCNSSPNWYSMQREEGVAVYGQFGWFYTYQPYVPTITNTFSSSVMLTRRCASCDSWVEVGWTKWPSLGYPSATYYSGWKQTGNPVMTWDFYEAAAPSTYVAYEIQWIGYAYATESYAWAAYINDLNTPRHIYNTDFQGGWPQSFAEAGGARSGTGIRARATPSHQLKDAGGAWHDWTPSYAPNTRGCNDPGTTWVWYSRYNDFYAYGAVP